MQKVHNRLLSMLEEGTRGNLIGVISRPLGWGKFWIWGRDFLKWFEERERQELGGVKHKDQEAKTIN